MELLTFKVLALIAVAVIAVVGGLIPLASAKFSSSERFFSLGNAFAGGLFLGVGFIHLLPEGMEILSDHSHFPWGAVAATAGFTLLLLLDRILFPENLFSRANHAPISSVVYPFVLLVMLSIHSVVAGISLGLEQHTVGLLAMLAGILFHKGPAAFALIVSAHAAEVKRHQQKVMLAIFAVMTPLGIMFGIASGLILVPEGEGYAIMQGTFNCFAAGTFIYIAVVDIIDKELTMHQRQMARYVLSAVAGDEDVPMPVARDDRFWKFLLVIAGTVLVGLVTHLMHTNGEHSEHEHEPHASTYEATSYTSIISTPYSLIQH